MSRASSIPPSARVSIADLTPDTKVVSYFVCGSREIATTRDGKTYLKLTLRDATGEVKAISWDPADDLLEHLAAGKVVKVVGQYTVSPQYGPQLKAQQISILEESQYDAAELVPVSPVPLAQLHDRLSRLVASVHSPHLRALLERATAADDEPGATFLVVPAAVRNHHAYRHGLLEHSLVVAEVAAGVAEALPGVDRDLVVAGGLLHDIGKTVAYSADPFAPGFTDPGRLLGEIVIGVGIVEKLAHDVPQMPADTLGRLLHIVVAHHGEREKGSPAVPMTREAIIVHYCDDMTARVAAFDEAERGTPAGDRWTSFSRMMDTMLYLGDEPAGGVQPAPASEPASLAPASPQEPPGPDTDSNGAAASPSGENPAAPSLFD